MRKSTTGFDGGAKIEFLTRNGWEEIRGHRCADARAATRFVNSASTRYARFRVIYDGVAYDYAEKYIEPHGLAHRTVLRRSIIA
jgi:hypothetical protein